jgi:hypothetical protein
MKDLVSITWNAVALVFGFYVLVVMTNAIINNWRNKK